MKFGYRKDPPKASDLDFSSNLKGRLVEVHPGDVDLRSFTTQTNQYATSSCAGNATADSVEILDNIASGRSGESVIQLSRLFVYTLARNLMDLDGDGKGDVDKDEGTFIRLCFDVLSKFGICREDLPVDQGGWPFDVSKVHTLPSLKAMRAATGHRIHSYYRISETGEARLDAILTALRANKPVVFGTRVDEPFTDLVGKGPVGPPKGPALGGHAMTIVGYDRSKGFLIKNSWGEGWGDGGCCFMDPEYLTWERTTDLWVPTKGSEFR